MGEYAGLDVSKEVTVFCVLNAAGKVLARGQGASDPEALFEVLEEHCLGPGRIVLETGTLSFWPAREPGKRGLPVDALDARPGRTGSGDAAATRRPAWRWCASWR